ncbi:MAG: ATP-binding protein [Daejeonella sp.]
MDQKLSFFNWSLKKLLDTEPDNFNKARITILFTIIVFSFVKLMVVIPAVYYAGQDFQLIRSSLLLILFIVFLKVLLFSRRSTTTIGTIIIWIGLLLTWTNLFITAQTINIITLQVVFMTILSGFYLLDWRWGLIYSFLGFIPIVILLVIGQGISMTAMPPAELASPAYELIVVLNFITIIIAHFLYYRAFNNNVAEKEALNLQLLQAVREANSAVKSKADFLSTMSHELRTPLNSVIGMTQLLMNKPYSNDQEENLKIINFSALHLHMLINDILDFSKLESDKLSLEAISTDLYKLITEISSGMRIQAKEKGLELIVQIDEVIRNTGIVTDPTRITQIIHNLLGNAIKFTHSGKVILKLEANKPGDDLIDIRFSVSDTGIGINAEQQESIFDAFTQASSSTSRNFGGTGLGLAIVKRLLILFNSDIHVNSAEGKGSEFFFKITFRTDDKFESVVDRKPDIKYNLPELKVLIVEDNPLNSLLLKKIFLNWNNIPVFAANGYEAIEKIEKSRYDVILMDIHMPLLDGYETTRVIRSMPDASRSGIPIIALTASSSDLADKIKEAGMNDFVNKPFNSDELYGKLRDITSGSEKPPANAEAYEITPQSAPDIPASL